MLESSSYSFHCLFEAASVGAEPRAGQRNALVVLGAVAGYPVGARLRSVSSPNIAAHDLHERQYEPSSACELAVDHDVPAVEFGRWCSASDPVLLTGAAAAGLRDADAEAADDYERADADFQAVDFERGAGGDRAGARANLYCSEAAVSTHESDGEFVGSETAVPNGRRRHHFAAEPQFSLLASVLSHFSPAAPGAGRFEAKLSSSTQEVNTYDIQQEIERKLARRQRRRSSASLCFSESSHLSSPALSLSSASSFDLLSSPASYSTQCPQLSPDQRNQEEREEEVQEQEVKTHQVKAKANADLPVPSIHSETEAESFAISSCSVDESLLSWSRS